MNNHFFKKIVGTAGLQLIGRIITILSGVYVARLLGPENFGRYSYALSIIAIGTIPALSGIPQLVVREISLYKSRNEASHMLGIIIWSYRNVLILSILAVITVFTLMNFLATFNSIYITLLIGLILIPTKGVVANQGSIINGMEKNELAQLPMSVIYPVLFFCFLIFLNSINGTVNSELVMLAQVFGHLGAITTGFFIVRKLIKPLQTKKSDVSHSKLWKTSLIPFAAITITSTFNNELATVILGHFSSEKAIGFFRISMQATVVLMFSVQAVSTVLGPRIVRCTRNGELIEAQEIINQSTRLFVVTSLIPGMLFILFGYEIVSFVFGNDYLDAVDSLRIITFAYVASSFFGPVALILTMTNNEKLVMKSQIITLLFTIIILLALVPKYQEIGAAVAIGISRICGTIILARYVRKFTILKPSLL